MLRSKAPSFSVRMLARPPTCLCIQDKTHESVDWPHCKKRLSFLPDGRARRHQMRGYTARLASSCCAACARRAAVGERAVNSPEIDDISREIWSCAMHCAAGSGSGRGRTRRPNVGCFGREGANLENHASTGKTCRPVACGKGKLGKILQFFVFGWGSVTWIRVPLICLVISTVQYSARNTPTSALRTVLASISLN